MPTEPKYRLTVEAVHALKIARFLGDEYDFPVEYRILLAMDLPKYLTAYKTAALRAEKSRKRKANNG